MPLYAVATESLNRVVLDGESTGGRKVGGEILVFQADEREGAVVVDRAVFRGFGRVAEEFFVFQVVADRRIVTGCVG